jgi:hypothetical protein
MNIDRYDMKTSYSHLIIAILFIMSICTILGNSQSPDSLPNQQAVVTADQAFALALKYTGFSANDSAKSISITAPDSKPAINDSIYYFLDSALQKHPLWKLEYENISLAPSKGDMVYPSKFTVLIDSLTGQLLMFTSDYAGYDSLVEKPEAMSHQGFAFPIAFKFIELPAGPPTHSFLQILSPNKAAQPTYARQYSAYYLTCSLLGENPKSYWFVVRRGGGESGHTASFPKKDGGTYNVPTKPLISLVVFDDESGATVFVADAASRIDTTGTPEK